MVGHSAVSPQDVPNLARGDARLPYSYKPDRDELWRGDVGFVHTPVTPRQTHGARQAHRCRLDSAAWEALSPSRLRITES